VSFPTLKFYSAGLGTRITVLAKASSNLAVISQSVSEEGCGLKVSGADRQNTVMSPMGLGTKNHCAGEGQQQFGSQSASQSPRKGVV
jgi:hypothetical protein